MITGCLQEKNNTYYAVLYIKVDGKRKTKWIPTGLPVEGTSDRKAKKAFDQIRLGYLPLSIVSNDDAAAPSAAVVCSISAAKPVCAIAFALFALCCAEICVAKDKALMSIAIPFVNSR